MSTRTPYPCSASCRTLLIIVALALPGARGGEANPAEPHHPLISGKGHADAALLKEFSDAEWLALVPAQSPRKAAGFAKLGEKNVPLSDWSWDAKNPNQLTCKATGEVYPSAKFPTKSIKAEVLSGKIVEIPYVDGGKKNEKAFPQVYIDYQKYLFIERQLNRLGAAYAGTGDDRYARIAAIILDEWANRIPDYFIGQGNPGLPPISPAEAEKNISEQFQIEHIERLNGKTLIYTHGDHALSVNTSGATEIMRPHRTFAGACRFTIYFSQSLQTFPH